MKNEKMEKEFNLSEKKCCNCGKKFEKGELVIPRYDNPKLLIHMNESECKLAGDKLI